MVNFELGSGYQARLPIPPSSSAWDRESDLVLTFIFLDSLDRTRVANPANTDSSRAAIVEIQARSALAELRSGFRT